MPAAQRLHGTNRLPLHFQVEERLRELIRQPEYERGELLPDEVTLARQWSVSRNTLRTAMLRLVVGGELERKAGVGTRVNRDRLSCGIGAWHSFTQEMARRGITVETYRQEARMVPADAATAAALQLEAGCPVLRLDRLRGWEGQPEVFFQSFLHPRLGLTPQSDFIQPLYRLIERESRVVAHHSAEEFVAVAAPPELAQLLGVKAGNPLLRRTRCVLDAGRRPIEHALVHYRCQRFSLSLNLRQEAL